MAGLEVGDDIELKGMWESDEFDEVESVSAYAGSNELKRGLAVLEERFGGDFGLFFTFVDGEHALDVLFADGRLLVQSGHGRHELMEFSGSSDAIVSTMEGEGLDQDFVHGAQVNDALWDLWEWAGSAGEAFEIKSMDTWLVGVGIAATRVLGRWWTRIAFDLGRVSCGTQGQVNGSCTFFPHGSSSVSVSSA
jgi:hypothetical protein